MSDERWIVVRNWDKFQHYSDRVPPWIKLYTAELVHDPAWDRLSAGSRGALVTIWAEYALCKGQFSSEALRKALGRSYEGAYLDRLVDAGFIDIVASKPLALRARSRKKRRGEDSKESSPSEARPRTRGPFERPRDGRAEEEEEKLPPYELARNFTRNVGGQLERLGFVEELAKFELTDEQRQKLDALYEQLHQPWEI